MADPKTNEPPERHQVGVRTGRAVEYKIKGPSRAGERRIRSLLKWEEESSRVDFVLGPKVKS